MHVRIHVSWAHFLNNEVMVNADGGHEVINWLMF